MPPEGKTAKLRTTALKGESKAYSLPFLKSQPYVNFAESLSSQSKKKKKKSATFPDLNQLLGKFCLKEQNCAQFWKGNPEWAPTKLPELKIYYFLPYIDFDFLGYLFHPYNNPAKKTY